MVTKVAGNQGQITLKGVQITDEWEQRVRMAAARNGQGFTAFVAETTDAAAVAILKGEPALPAALPARLEDVSASLAEQIAALAERQDARIIALAEEQRDRLERIERASRRGRWRK